MSQRYFIAALAVWCWATPPTARAAGMFLTPRGVRPLAQGGAFVAGADDVNALSYNPAGLAEATNSVLLDAALPLHSTTYTRGDGGYDDGTATGTGMGLPSPGLGIVHDLGWVSGLRMGLAITTDVPNMQNWSAAADAPQRYAAGNYNGTALSKIILGAGYRVNDWLRLGASLQLLAGNFAAINTVSTCDGVVCTQPENPAYDATIQMRAHGIWVPGLQVGFQIEPLPWLAVGAAWESGYRIDAAASFAMRLPSAPAYAGASLDPQTPRGTVTMTLPSQWRVGAQARWTDVRIEADYVYEPWSVHNQIGIDLQDAAMKNMFALGTYTMGRMRIARGFTDTWSVRLGGEYRPPLDERPLILRAGAMYEPSAIPNVMLTPAVVDLNKIMAALGAQYSWGAVHVEAVVAHVFMFDQRVTASQVFQANPTRSEASGMANPIGNGLYQSSANIFGLGMRVDI